MALSADSRRCEENAPRVPDPRISEALRFMEANLHDSSLTVGDMARQAGLSRTHFSSLFRAETGSSPGRMLSRMGMELAGELLSGKRALPLKEVGARVGVPRPDVFARAFREWYAMTPSDFRSIQRHVRGRP
jgi:AraC-like DNA-binding protein